MQLVLSLPAGGQPQLAPNCWGFAKDWPAEGGGGGEKPRHPFIEGLPKTLPDPDSDEEWPLDKRVKWLQTAAHIFDLIYKGEGGIEVHPALAQRSPRPHE